MSSSPIILILGAGPNIGANVAKTFATNGYKVILTSRKPTPDSVSPYAYVQGDLTQPQSVNDIFSEVRRLHGEPSVVVYNAAGVSFLSKDDPFSVDLSTFQSHMDVNTTSAFIAIKQSLASFASPSLPQNASRTFIYTGNAMNFAPFPGVMTLGVGKSASAHLIAAAAQAYEPKGFKFYYADERQADGKLCGKVISGEAHAELYKELSETKSQAPWLQTFVKGKGYVRFSADTDVSL